MKKTIIRSVEEYLSKIQEINANQVNVNHSPIYYRGQTKNFGKTNYLPGVFRQSSNDRTNALKENTVREREFYLADAITRRFPETFSNCNNFERLAKMQHNQLQTRLLDVTKDPLIALYFAVEDAERSKDDGEITAFGDTRPKVSPNSLLAKYGTIINPKSIFRNANSDLLEMAATAVFLKPEISRELATSNQELLQSIQKNLESVPTITEFNINGKNIAEKAILDNPNAFLRRILLSEHRDTAKKYSVTISNKNFFQKFNVNLDLTSSVGVHNPGATPISKINNQPDRPLSGAKICLSVETKNNTTLSGTVILSAAESKNANDISLQEIIKKNNLDYAKYTNSHSVKNLFHNIELDAGNFGIYPDISDINSIVFATPPFIEPRIKNQKGEFLFPIFDTDPKTVEEKMEKLRTNWFKIPQEDKEKIKYELDVLFGINESYVYPDLSNNALYLNSLNNDSLKMGQVQLLPKKIEHNQYLHKINTARLHCADIRRFKKGHQN